jgi:hypothetical protein
VCRNAGLPLKQSFFKGNITTLRTHISRKPKTHFLIYKAKCDRLEIPINARAVPPSEQGIQSLTGKQSTLDGVVQILPQFTKAGLLEYIIKLIVSEDEAFQLVDKASFRDLLRYCRPNLPERDIPHRTKVRDEIITKAGIVVDRIRVKLEVSTSLHAICHLTNECAGNRQ